MPAESFIEAAVRIWLSVAEDRIKQASTVHRLSDGQKAAIEIQLPECTALIELWEHARCIDTTIHMNGKQQGIVLAAGPCANEQLVRERIQELRSALEPSLGAA